MKAKGKKQISFDLIRTVAAIGLSVVVAIAIILLISKEPGTAIQKFLIGPLTNKRYIGNIIELMTPLMYTGLAVALIFRMKIFNLAVEGMFYSGGMVAAVVACLVPMDGPLHALTGLFMGMLAGMIVSFIPAALKVRFGANEIVSSLMLNYIVFKVGDYILKTFLRDPQVLHVTSYSFPKSATLPKLFGNVHAGLMVILILLVLAYLFLFKTRWGYQIRITGENPLFGRYSGMNVLRVVFLTQLLGGLIAGLGGASYVLGATQRFTWEWRSNYGWDGLVVAIIARYNPKWIPLGAFILSYLRIGSDIMSRHTDVTNEVVAIIQGIIIVLVASVGFLESVKHKRTVRAAKEEAEA